MTKGKTLDDFRASHDRDFMLKTKIENALIALGESWEYEADFLRRSGLSGKDWAARRDKYIDRIVDVKSGFGAQSDGGKRRVIAGTKAFAAKLRAQLAK